MSQTYTLPAGTMASAFADANITSRTVESGTSYFDIQDTIENDLPHPLLRARVTSSMVWMIDNTIINTARMLFWKARNEFLNIGHIDNFNEMISAVTNMQANENYVDELGFELETNTLRELCTLMGVSQHWHDVAEAAASNANSKYVHRSYEELLMAEKPQAINSLTERKLRALTEVTLGDEVSAEELAAYQKLIVDRQRTQFETLHATRQQLNPAVLNIINFANYRNANADASFWHLSVESQRRLILGTIKAIERAQIDLSNYRSITELEYIGLIREARAVTKHLEGVLNTGKFADVAEQAYIAARR